MKLASCVPSVTRWQKAFRGCCIVTSVRLQRIRQLDQTLLCYYSIRVILGKRIVLRCSFVLGSQEKFSFVNSYENDSGSGEACRRVLSPAPRPQKQSPEPRSLLKLTDPFVTLPKAP